jgi:hypothetical protein
MADAPIADDLAPVARDANVLAAYLGMRDVPELTRSALEESCGLA